jgi:hypothetical protein
LRVQLEIEQRSLDQALQDYSGLGEARVRLSGRVVQLYQELDAMVEGRIESEPEQILDREREVAAAEKELEAVSLEGSRLRAQIRGTHDRISLLQSRIRGLRDTLPADDESLTGSWDVTYLPSEDKGLFQLRQAGTLLVGEYTLEGGWTGSLQGTFVNGKVLLHRIDSKLGRSSDLEGTLSPDGLTVRGRWQNFILSGGQPTSGSWVARKRPRAQEP